MATSAKIIVTNTTGSPIYISDLCNQFIDSTSQIVLSDYYSFFEITTSTTLRNLINAGTVTISDDYGVLTKEAALKHVSEVTKYESKSKLIELDDVGPPPATYDKEILVSDGTSLNWVHFPHEEGAVVGGVNFTMSDHAAHDYVANGTSVWTSIRTFVFDGTSVWVPTTFLMIGSMAKIGAIGYARLYDYTNNNVIATLSWENVPKAIYYTSTLTNLPTQQAIFELQTMTSKNGTDVQSHYMALY